MHGSNLTDARMQVLLNHFIESKHEYELSYKHKNHVIHSQATTFSYLNHPNFHLHKMDEEFYTHLFGTNTLI